jgi:hypothetical protein
MRDNIVDFPGDPIFAAIEGIGLPSEVRRVRQLADGMAFVGPDKGRIARRAFIERSIGNEDEFTDGPSGDAWKAFVAFANTVPSTLAGLVAMLNHAGQCSAEEYGDRAHVIILSLATAARTLIGEREQRGG